MQGERGEISRTSLPLALIQQANTPSDTKRRPVLQANTPSGSKRRSVLQANTPSRSKRRPVLHRSGLRGQKGGLFCTVPGCAAQKAACFAGQHPVGVKKAVCFSPFRAARRKRRSVLHSATPRGCCIGPSFRADYKTKPDTPWKSHHVPGKLRWRPKTPRQILLWWPQTPRTDSQASADARRRPR